MGGIFISYRREDAAPWAGRLYERLAHSFPRDRLLMDVDTIEPGLDFLKELDKHVSHCEVLLAIIGRGWTEAMDSKGRRRLDDPNDFVRIELSSALKRDIRVIPILVDGAHMPSDDVLPDPLKSLARRNAVQLSHERFGTDIQRLVEVLQQITASPVPQRSAPSAQARATTPSRPIASAPTPLARGEVRVANRNFASKIILLFKILGMVITLAYGIGVISVWIAFFVSPPPAAIQGSILTGLIIASLILGGVCTGYYKWYRAPRKPLQSMNAQQILIRMVTGVVAGWLGSVVVGGGGGLIRYLITGIIGAFVGGVVFKAAGWKLNLSSEWLNQTVIAAIGAIIVLILAHIIA